MIGAATSTAAAATFVGSPARVAPAKKQRPSGAVCFDGALDQHQREQELVPGVDEDERAQRRDRGPRLREQDAAEHAEARRAVDAAASISERGDERKKARIQNVPKETDWPICGRISAQ